MPILWSFYFNPLAEILDNHLVENRVIGGIRYIFKDILRIKK